MDVETLDTKLSGRINIKVIGIGGAGGNAVQHMIRKGVQGVEFICMNTDAGALQRSKSSINIQLGSTGLGAGAKPEVGAAAAIEAKVRITDALQNAHMVFITAGMGGGTGTGAAPIVAQVAKEMGILTVGVISKPFVFEGIKRSKIAEIGSHDLENHVDSLIVVLNEKLFEVMGEDAEMDKAFACADDVLHNAVAGIAEIINEQGLINVDFEDVKTVMSEQGKAMMGTATASGADRARLAAESAVASPLLEGVDLSGARGVLVNISAGHSLKLSETRTVMTIIHSYAAEDATVIFGTVYDDSLEDALRVTVVATGLNNENRCGSKQQPEAIWRSTQIGMHDTLNQVATDSRTFISSSNANVQTNPRSSLVSQISSVQHTDYSQYDIPKIFRNNRENSVEFRIGNSNSPEAQAMIEKGTDYYDIPAFLRKQVD